MKASFLFPEAAGVGGLGWGGESKGPPWEPAQGSSGEVAPLCACSVPGPNHPGKRDRQGNPDTLPPPSLLLNAVSAELLVDLGVKLPY